MYTVASAAEALDRIAPLKTQMDWDNSGLLVGDPSREITKILVALDATLSVIREAEALGLTVEDYFLREELAVGNAAAKPETAVFCAPPPV